MELLPVAGGGIAAVLVVGAAVSLYGVVCGRIGLVIAGIAAILIVLLPDASWAPLQS